MDMLDDVSKFAATVGLSVNKAKTKVMRIYTQGAK